MDSNSTLGMQLDALMADPANDLFGFNAEELDQRVQKYASGVLSPAIWEGFRRANRSMCIAASEAGQPAIERACQFVRDGGELLVDSGAFIYRDKPNQMPWRKVLSVYQSIADAATVPVTFILPDVVGDQEQTLVALREWGSKVVEAVGINDRLLLPVQAGGQSPSAFVKSAMLCLAAPIDGLAIPSHAAAFPPEQIADLANVPVSIPRRVHFLGISRNSQGLNERILRLREAWPSAEVSCDACEHRAQIGQGRPVTLARASALNDMWDEEIDAWDDTECDETNEMAMQALRKRFPTLDDDGLEAMMLSQQGAWLQLEAKSRMHAKEKGPAATTESIYAFATGTVDDVARKFRQSRAV